jgi:hypothetical protein
MAPVMSQALQGKEQLSFHHFYMCRTCSMQVLDGVYSTYNFFGSLDRRKINGQRCMASTTSSIKKPKICESYDLHIPNVGNETDPGANKTPRLM